MPPKKSSTKKKSSKVKKTKINNQQEDQTSSDHQTDRLTMDWHTRDCLISLLNRFSALLVFKTTVTSSDDLKKHVDELMNILIDLPPESQQDRATKLTFTITRDERIKLIEHLIKNKDFSIMRSESVSTQMKLDLVDENNDLITFLTKLIKPTDQSGLTKFSDHEYTSEDDQQAKNAKTTIDEHISGVKNQLKDELKDDLNNQFEELKELTLALNKSLCSIVEKQVEDFEIIKHHVFSLSEVTFTHEFNRNIKWRLQIISQLTNGARKIGLYLFCYHTDPVQWSIKTTYELRLLSLKAGIKNKLFRMNYTFVKDEGRGPIDFIGVANIESSDRGYIKDGHMIAQVHLKADRLVKM